MVFWLTSRCAERISVIWRVRAGGPLGAPGPGGGQVMHGAGALDLTGDPNQVSAGAQIITMVSNPPHGLRLAVFA